VGTVGIVVGLYSVTNTPANIFFGRLIDRIGYKVPLIIGLLGDALSMFLYSLCRLPVHLALVRILHGATGAMVGPATMLVSASYSGKGRKGRAMSFYGMALAAATLVGYGLSGFLASRFGFSFVFLFGAGVLIVGVVLSLLLPDNRKKQKVRDTASSGQGLGVVKELIGRNGLKVAYVSIFAQYFTLGGVVTLMPLYVKNLGMEVFYVGMMMASFSVVFIITQFPLGRLSDRSRRFPLVAIGLSVGIISLVVLPSVAAFSLLVLAMALYGVAYGVLFPTVSALVADNTAEEERGLAMGIFHALLTAGVAIGAPVMGWVAEAAGVRLSLLLNPLVMLAALVIMLKPFKRF